MSRSILLVSFQYPPVQVSSGLLRLLAFSRDLADSGWDVTVLTSSIGFENCSIKSNLTLIPDNVEIVRTRAFDAAEKLSIFGRYPDCFEWPDRHSSWVISATLTGYRVFRRKQFDVILSSYPTASAQLIGYFLSKLTGRPWVADFRDPMIMDNHPDTEFRRRAHAWVEQKAVTHCDVATMTNHRARASYISRFPQADSEKFRVIENGYDEVLFDQVAQQRGTPHLPLESANTKLQILHSGTVYPDHRNPVPLFKAIKWLTTKGLVEQIEFVVVFRASGHDDYLKQLISQYGIEKYVEIAPVVSYLDALTEVINSDGLLLIQGESCNLQVPAKLYEYIRAGRPIFPLVDPDGATADVLRDIDRGCDYLDIAKEGLASAFKRFLLSLQNGSENLAYSSVVEDTSRFSRKHWSNQLARDLNDRIP